MLPSTLSNLPYRLHCRFLHKTIFLWVANAKILSLAIFEIKNCLYDDLCENFKNFWIFFGNLYKPHFYESSSYDSQDADSKSSSFCVTDCCHPIVSLQCLGYEDAMHQILFYLQLRSFYPIFDRFYRLRIGSKYRYTQNSSF